MEIYKPKPKILLTTSLKGGVGKSTVAANLALYLALEGKKTLLCDMDFGVRSLDLVMGFEDRMIFNICDCISGKVSFVRAAVADTRTENLYFLGAPYSYNNEFTNEFFAEKLKEIAKREEFDYVILDTPGGNTDTLKMSAAAAEGALVVTSHHPAAVRGAAKSAEIMQNLGLYTRLIINCFDGSAVLSGKRDGMLELIDSTGVPLIGVVPYDKTLAYAQEKGILAFGERFVSSHAFSNIATRLIAEDTYEKKIPILKGVKCAKRKKLLTR